MTALAESAGLSVTDVATALLHAAAKAVKENHGRMPIPLDFRIVDQVPITTYSRAEDTPRVSLKKN